MATAAHVVITRFCCRSNWAGPRAGVYWKKQMDPLRTTNVRRRFALLEAVCLPNLLAQTRQDFEWIVLVDKDLRQKDRTRLAKLCGQRPGSVLHTYTGEDLRGIDWLSPYLPRQFSSVITTLWDDDDALPIDYFSRLRSHLEESRNHWSPLRVAGSKDCVQWDMLMDRKRPLGILAPWHRGNFPKSPGFSVLSSPPFSVSVLGMDHTIGEVWYERHRGKALDDLLMKSAGEHSNPYMEQLLDEFQDWLGFADLLELERARHSNAGLFCDLTSEVGSVLMTNHGKNAQSSRLWEAKSQISKVRGAESFDRINIDWTALHRDRRLFSRRRIRTEVSLDRSIQHFQKLNRRIRKLVSAALRAEP